MPKRYPPWVITNMVAYLKLKLSQQYPKLIFDNASDGYTVDLSYDYPRLYLNASNDITPADKTRCNLGHNNSIEVGVLLRDYDKSTKHMLFKFEIKSYKDFNLVINSMQQTTCDYLNNLTELDCAATALQKWIPVWSNGLNICPDKHMPAVEKIDPNNLSPDLYKGYFERGGDTHPDNNALHLDRDDGDNISFDNYNYVSYHEKDDGNNINPDNNAGCDEVDNGSEDYNNLKDPYLSITQITKPSNDATAKQSVKETAEQTNERRTNIVNDIKNVWALLSYTTLSKAMLNQPIPNDKLGGVLFAQGNPLKIIWTKYDFKSIHEYMLSLGKLVQQEEKSIDSIAPIHSSSAEFDPSARSRSKRAKQETKVEPAQKSTIPSEPPSRPFFLYLSPTPEEGIDKLDTPTKSAPKLDELTKDNHSRDSSEQVKNPKRRREDEDDITDEATQIPVPLPVKRKSDLAKPSPVLLPDEKKSDLTTHTSVPLSPPHKSSFTLFGHTPTTHPIKPSAPLPLTKPSAPKINSEQYLKTVAPAKPKAPQIKQQPAAAKPKAAINPTPPIAKPKTPINPTPPVVKPKIPKQESPSLIARLAEKIVTPPPSAKPVATQSKAAASSKPTSIQAQAFSSVAKAKPLKPAIKKAAKSAADKAVKFSDTALQKPTNTALQKPTNVAPQTPAKSFDGRKTIEFIDDILATHKKKKAAAATELTAKQAAKNTERGQIDVNLEKVTSASTDQSVTPRRR